jgi:hypothetical protein
MTEAEWLACTDPTPMLEYLRGKASDRKLRLFACACCRRMWHLLADRRSRAAVGVGERLADGAASEAEARAARGAAYDAYDRGPDAIGDYAAYAAVSVCHTQAQLAAAFASVYTAWAAGDHSDGDRDEAEAAEAAARCILLRCIFGNPFRSVCLDPAWLAWNDGTIPKLAQAIYDERRFSDLPILADALEEAGCSNPDILAHCRSEGPHVRGCWVVDLILGKE